MADQPTVNSNPTPDPTHGLTVQHADALWDAVAIPGPQEPTFPVQHERVCRAVAGILDELAPAAPSAVDQTTRDRIAEALAPFFANFSDWETARINAGEATAAVLAVSPPPADRTADTSEDRCGECGHFRGAHKEAEEPVSVGRCTVCADEDEWHDFEALEQLRRLADEAQQLAVGARQPDTETPTAPCSWVAVKSSHSQHTWAPQPGMDPVHCPGYTIPLADQPTVVPGRSAATDTSEETGRIVAYRSALPGAWSLYCTRHVEELGACLPLTSADLPDGGLCVQCGADVLIPQNGAEQ